MRTSLRKIAKLFLALLIPANILIACQEDLPEPHASSLPPKSEVKLPPGSN